MGRGMQMGALEKNQNWKIVDRPQYRSWDADRLALRNIDLMTHWILTRKG